MGDAVVAAIDGQDLSDGYYHLDRMLRGIVTFWRNSRTGPWRPTAS
jgi:hypothetical protein